MAESAQAKTFDVQVFRRMMAYARPYRLRFVATLGLIILLAVLGPLRPYLINEMVQGPIKSGDWSGLIQWTILIISLLVLESILQYFQTYSANTLGQNVILDIRKQLFRHMAGFRMKYFDRTPIGRIVTRAVSDIETIADVFSSGILVILGDLLKLVLVVSFMLAMNWELTLIVLIPVPVLLIATRIFKNSIEKAFRKVRTEVSRLNTFVQEHIQGMSIVQTFGREKEEQARFRAINKEHRTAHIRSVWAYSIFFPVVELLSAISIALLILYALGHVDEGGEDAYQLFGETLAFILYTFMLYRPIRQLADRFNVLQMGMVGSERVFEVLDTDADLVQSGQRKDVSLKGNIRFDKVWMAYKEEEYILKDIDLEVAQGQTIAFVGTTGAGKSSIINLLGRFYEFQRGRILFEGVDIREFDKDFLRKHISVVQQDVFLFSESIMNNITLHDPNVTREEVIAAAKAVGAHNFIEQLPGSYDFDVAERGRVLSAGQRQLLAFIRAYVQNPDVLILDEATSSVDSESEALIQAAQERLTKDRTSIVIAHRLSTIQQADRIYVLDKGRIVEEGDHSSLLEQAGMYKRLYDMQFN